MAYCCMRFRGKSKELKYIREYSNEHLHLFPCLPILYEDLRASEPGILLLRSVVSFWGRITRQFVGKKNSGWKYNMKDGYWVVLVIPHTNSSSTCGFMNSSRTWQRRHCCYLPLTLSSYFDREWIFDLVSTYSQKYWKLEIKTYFTIRSVREDAKVLWTQQWRTQIKIHVQYFVKTNQSTRTVQCHFWF